MQSKTHMILDFSNTETANSNSNHGTYVLSAFFCVVLSFVGRSSEMGIFPVQGVLSSVYRDSLSHI
jgi:hypothetical protein